MDRDKFDKMQSMTGTPVEPQTVEEINKVLKELRSDHEEPPTGMQYGFDVVEVQKVGLKPGDVLMVTVKNNDLDQDSIDALRSRLERLFPENNVFVFAMKTEDDVKFSVVTAKPVSYCSDCNCGKKEKA